jgi:hypothetical protein
MSVASPSPPGGSSVESSSSTAGFEAMCKGYLRISSHWHLFRYFFKFACLKDGSQAAMIGCANLRMKQGWGDDYITSSLTSSNSN